MAGRLDRKAVEELKQYQLEIRQNHPGEIFEDSVELLRQIREDRTRELEQRLKPPTEEPTNVAPT